MKSILDTLVSCVPNYYSKEPRNVNLLTWLTSHKYAHVVAQIRQCADKELRKKLKGSLPAITPSGLFSRVDEQHMVRHSGFIQFDIDAQDNRDITNYHVLHTQLQRIANVAYCGKSVSGNGWWGLVPIAHTDKHTQHFRYMQRVFATAGIVLDEAPKSIASLRGYSYDSDAYFNHEAQPLQLFMPLQVQHHPLAVHVTSATRSLVLQLIALLEHQQRDITDGYKAWFAIGCNFAATFGEEGRDYYHRVSCMHPNYTVADTDYRYHQCLLFVQAKNSTAGMGYFMKLCAEAGVRVAA